MGTVHDKKKVDPYFNHNEKWDLDQNVHDLPHGILYIYCILYK